MKKIKTAGLGGMLLVAVVLGSFSLSLGALWDEDCEKAISQIQEAQKRLAQNYRNYEIAELAHHVPQGFVTQFAFQQGQNEDQYSRIVQQVKNSVEEFNVRLTIFNNVCFEKP